MLVADHSHEEYFSAADPYDLSCPLRALHVIGSLMALGSHPDEGYGVVRGKSYEHLASRTNLPPSP